MFNLFKNKTDILSALDALTDGIKAGSLKTLENNTYASNTHYAYQSTVTHLKEFLAGKALTEMEISPYFFDNFTKWLVDRGYSKNTVWNNVKFLKTMINRLMKNGIIAEKNLGKLTVKKEVTTAIFSTEKEIQQLYELDLNLTEGLKTVRDLYVLQCYTGLRFSDLHKFMQNPRAYVKHTDGISYIDITTTKTHQQLIIPLKPIALRILEDNNYKFGKKGGFSLQHYNTTLKKIAAHINFDDEIIVVRTIGGKRTETVKKKHELISSHTARRSFATNAFLAGISSLQIRKITGHTTESSFLHYIRATGLETAMTLLNHPFFK